ncbi:MAG TPA: right-handed parallel beta-helix repeat-containing protein [Pyrinomonadaceae bacterium]|jgi:hypothetical protein
MLNKSKITIFGGLILLASAAAAFAQTMRVYVSASGDDANSCTMTAQCRTVTKALSIVDAGGEVVITASGDYDKFVVNKSVTVAAETGVNAAIVSSVGSAISIVGVQPGDAISFRNLHLVGIGGQTSDGIINSFAGTLTVDGCVFTGFNNALTMSNVGGQLYVHDTTIRGSLFGIGILAQQSEGVLKATIDNCELEMNDTGIMISGKVSAEIRNSIFAGNTSRGLQVRSTAANWRAEALVDNCQFNHNTAGILAGATSGGFAVVRLSRSSIVNNALSGVSIGAGGTVFTLGNNVIAANFPDVNGGSLTPLAAK